jgi:hypothetical protein
MFLSRLRQSDEKRQSKEMLGMFLRDYSYFALQVLLLELGWFRTVVCHADGY